MEIDSFCFNYAENQEQEKEWHLQNEKGVSGERRPATERKEQSRRATRYRVHPLHYTPSKLLFHLFFSVVSPPHYLFGQFEEAFLFKKRAKLLDIESKH